MKLKIDALWDDKPVDVTTEVNFIWSIANKLRGPYQPDKYKDVIIPMVILRRIECALEPYKKAVLDYVAKNPDPAEQRVYKISHYPFYNASPLSLAELCNDADNLAANFSEYVDGFSSRVKEILTKLDLEKQVEKMDKNNRLLPVVKAFSELDLNPKTIDSIKMGYIFEDLIRRFSENAEAGDHYTGRDIIKLMVMLLLSVGCDDLTKDGTVVPIMDEAGGTGGILTTMTNCLAHFCPGVDVEMFGQEINPESYAICLAEMLIKGYNPDNFKNGDSMKSDCAPGQKMRFVAENPPFGQPWAGKDAPEGTEEAVKREFLRGGAIIAIYRGLTHPRAVGLPVCRRAATCSCSSSRARFTSWMRTEGPRSLRTGRHFSRAARVRVKARLDGGFLSAII